MREAEKEKKKIYPRILFILDTGKKIPKKIAKKFKKLKKLIPAIFLSRAGVEADRDREKKNFSPEFRS